MRTRDSLHIRECFFSLVRAGLWGEGPQPFLNCVDELDTVLALAREQGVVGLVAKGIEIKIGENLPKRTLLPMIGEMLQIEQRNIFMNTAVAQLFELLNNNGIIAVLVKGQGVAQCYADPLFRSSGDVDLLLNAEDYDKAKKIICPIASSVEEENMSNLHLGMTMKEGYVLELHGSLRARLWPPMDKVIDDVQNEMFSGGESTFRIWKNGDTDVLLPAANADVVFIFSHILQHFFKGGVGLRQVCDWCRLLWTYHAEIDESLLEKRIKEMGLMSEWKSFAALAVVWLGMPKEKMPMYDNTIRWTKRAGKVLDFIIETGSFGQNRDFRYYEKYPYIVSKAISLWRNSKDSIKHLTIFPYDAVRVWWRRLKDGFETVKRGK